MHRVRTNIKRIAAAGVLGAALPLLVAAPASAHKGHNSCAGFADFITGWAQGGYDEAGFDNPGWKPFTRDLEGNVVPGQVAWFMDHEHDLYCD